MVARCKAHPLDRACRSSTLATARSPESAGFPPEMLSDGTTSLTSAFDAGAVSVLPTGMDPDAGWWSVILIYVSSYW